MAVFNLGRFYPIFRGDWTPTDNYKILDIVLYQGSSWVAKADNSGIVPTVGSLNWQMVAKSGEISGVLTPDQRDSIVADIITTGGFVSDPEYVHTDRNFTAEAENAINNIGDGELVINVNGVEVGTFGANSRERQSINIPTPTRIDQLSGSDQFYRVPKINEFTDPEVVIPLAEGGNVYIFEQPISSLTIESLEYSDRKEAWDHRDIEFYFTAAEGFKIEAPSFLARLDEKEVVFGDTYLMTIHAGMIRIEKVSNPVIG